MTARRLYPYAFSHDIDLRIDASEPEIAMDDPTRYLRLWEDAEESWRLCARIRIPQSVLDDVLPPDERLAPPVVLRLRLRSISSRLRRVLELPLPKRPADIVDLDFDIETENWSGFIDAEVVLIRTCDSAHHEGRWATRRGTIVADAATVRIAVDEPATPPGDSLAVQWLDFDASEIPQVQAARGTLFVLQPSDTGQPPTLLLNSSIPGSRLVLDSRGKHGWAARSRDAVFQMIVHQGWSSLVGSALGELKDEAAQRPEEAEEVLEEVLGALPEWMQNVLRAWSPLLWPEEPDDRAVERTWEAVRAGHWEELLEERLPTAVAKRFDTAKGLRGLVTEYGG